MVRCHCVVNQGSLFYLYSLCDSVSCLPSLGAQLYLQHKYLKQFNFTVIIHDRHEKHKKAYLAEITEQSMTNKMVHQP